MYSQEDISDELRKKFCRSLVPIHLVERSGIKQTQAYLDVEQFSEKLHSFFSSATLVKAKPLEKNHDLFATPFIIGESHSHISPKKFLIEHMNKMKENGCEILFMEHLFYDTNQKDLDEFFKTGELSPDLMSRLKEMNRSGMGHSFGSASEMTSPLWKENDYIALLHAARKAGIRVVGIDISTVYNSQKIGVNDEQLDDTRIRYMNYTAAHIIEREISLLPKNKTWCGFMGNAHVKTFENTPGVADLFGARSVFVFDQKHWINSTAPSNGKIELDGEFIYSQGKQIFKGDVIYQIDPRLKTSLFEQPLDSSSVYKKKLAHLVEPPIELTRNDLDLTVKYLANLDLVEVGKLFGFEKALDHSYHLIENIKPMNETKPVEENNTFCILLESEYSSMPSYTLYLSKEQLLDFSTLQQEAEMGNQLH